LTQNDELIKALEEALAFSPANITLRRQYAKLLTSRGRITDAEKIYREGLELAPQSEQMKLGLAECYQKLGKTSAALVIVEELLSKPDCPGEVYLLYTFLLIAKGQLEQAAAAYTNAVRYDPGLASDELEQTLGLEGNYSETQWQDEDVDEQGRIRMRAGDASGDDALPIEMEKPGITFADVGGMDDLKEQIRLKIIEPMRNPDLYKAYGKAVGGSILMYGPPGCGKTHLARATAGHVDAEFLPIGIHDVLDMYIGNSEQKLHALFESARRHSPCVMFFDEVDALGASRSDMRQSAGRHLINQFLSELDGIASNNEGILILAATNAPWHLDAAFRRPGRFDRLLFVPPPDEPARVAILEVLLRDKPLADIDYLRIAKIAKKFSGADLKLLVSQTIENKLQEAIKSGTPSPISTRDLLNAVKTIKPSTDQWFSSAKNYALYANDGGVYNDILSFMNLL